MARLCESDGNVRCWASVALFYSANQLAHSVLAVAQDIPEHLRHPTSHKGTHGGAMNDVLRTRRMTVWPHYLSLFSESVAVRYEGRKVSDEAFRGLEEDYHAVRAWARTEIKQGAPDLLRDPQWP